MEALSHNNIHDFLTTAGDFLNADPVNHSVHLTGIDAALRGERNPITLISLHDNGTVIGAVTQMEGRPLHVAAMPVAAAPAVVKALREREANGPTSPQHRGLDKVSGAPHHEVNEVSGTRDGVEAFRKLWREGGSETYALRLYRLEELAEPDVPGEPRLATPADDDLITDWWIAFAAELDGLTRAEAEQRAMGSRGMSAGHVLWLVDGVPVSWAGSTTPVGGVSRVGPVYTPPAHRRRGYAGAVTAAVSRWALGAGAEHVVLTADLADPTANSVYLGIGFRAVTDWSEYRW